MKVINFSKVSHFSRCIYALALKFSLPKAPGKYPIAFSFSADSFRKTEEISCHHKIKKNFPLIFLLKSTKSLADCVSWNFFLATTKKGKRSEITLIKLDIYFNDSINALLLPSTQLKVWFLLSDKEIFIEIFPFSFFFLLRERKGEKWGKNFSINVDEWGIMFNLFFTPSFLLSLE